jgi:hypothetical protein
MQGDNMKNYQFKTKPYDHQKEIWEKSWFEPYYALFAEMGTGKSKIAIDTIGALYLTGTDRYSASSGSQRCL